MVRVKDKCPSCFQPIAPTDFLCPHCELILNATAAATRPVSEVSVVRRLLEIPQRGVPAERPDPKAARAFAKGDGSEGPTRVLNLGPELSGVPVVVATLSRKSEQLTELEAWVVSLIDGLNDAEALAKKAGLREFELRVLLRTLSEKQIIDFADEPLSDEDLGMPILGTLESDGVVLETPGATVDRRDARFVIPPAPSAHDDDLGLAVASAAAEEPTAPRAFESSKSPPPFAPPPVASSRTQSPVAPPPGAFASSKSQPPGAPPPGAFASSKSQPPAPPPGAFADSTSPLDPPPGAFASSMSPPPFVPPPGAFASSKSQPPGAPPSGAFASSKSQPPGPPPPGAFASSKSQPPAAPPPGAFASSKSQPPEAPPPGAFASSKSPLPSASPDAAFPFPPAPPRADASFPFPPAPPRTSPGVASPFPFAPAPAREAPRGLAPAPIVGTPARGLPPAPPLVAGTPVRGLPQAARAAGTPVYGAPVVPPPPPPPSPPEPVRSVAPPVLAPSIAPAKAFNRRADAAPPPYPSAKPSREEAPPPAAPPLALGDAPVERTDPRIAYTGNVNRKVLDALKKVKRADPVTSASPASASARDDVNAADVLARDSLQVALRMEQGGRLDEAIRFLERSIAQSPDAPSLYNRLGIILMRERSDLRRAEEMIRKATELAPDNAVYAANLRQVISQQALKRR